MLRSLGFRVYGLGLQGLGIGISFEFRVEGVYGSRTSWCAKRGPRNPSLIWTVWPASQNAEELAPAAQRVRKVPMRNLHFRHQFRMRAAVAAELFPACRTRICNYHTRSRGSLPAHSGASWRGIDKKGYEVES